MFSWYGAADHPCHHNNFARFLVSTVDIEALSPSTSRNPTHLCLEDLDRMPVASPRSASDNLVTQRCTDRG